MATVSFLWHLHQPAYRTADGVSHAPWTALHAGGAYMTLARAIEASGGRGQVVNIVPTLLEQLIAYRDGTVTDPVLEAITTPVTDLTDRQRQTLVEWGFHVTPRQLERYPRLGDLAQRRGGSETAGRLEARFGRGDLRDLQVLMVLSQAGAQAWSDPRLEDLHDRGQHFSDDDHRCAVEWLLAQPGELLTCWKEISEQTDVEISTSPYAHPIMPLIVDTGIVADSWAPHPPPVVPSFRHPEDARRQLIAGLELMREHGFAPQGCWPPEGSVSEQVVEIYGSEGVRWLVTDEGILERSLDRPLRDAEKTSPDLYRVWRMAFGGPALLFRDRRLSDSIGFQYGRWGAEDDAAADLVRRLEACARSLPANAHIVLALDGENPWLHYHDGGLQFLTGLMTRLAAGNPLLDPKTLSDVAGTEGAGELAHLHPGSWINSVFATWIGHPEKTAAWRALSSVREAIAGAGPEMPPSLMLAEGSDWFWWLGDDNPTELAPLYDRIFRHHLADACEQAGVDPPIDLERALKTVTQTVRVPVSGHWPTPRFDGLITSYFEWSLASWVEGAADSVLRRLAVWADAQRLYVMVEGSEPVQQLVENDELSIVLQQEDGSESRIVVGQGVEAPGGDLVCAVDRVAECSFPWNGHRGCRLVVRIGEQQLPPRSALLLEPFVVDEDVRTPQNRESRSV